MQTSEQTNELFTALIAARAELANPPLDSKGHGYDYASLPNLIDLVSPVMLKHSLSLVQGVDHMENGDVVVSSRIIHTSGQWIEARLALPPANLSGGAGKNPVQCMGASITYGRRYQLTAMLNICGDKDTDAAGYEAPRQQPRMQATAPAPNGLIAEVNDLGKQVYGDGWADTIPGMAVWASDDRVGSIEELTSQEAQKAIKGLQKKLKEK